MSKSIPVADQFTLVDPEPIARVWSQDKDGNQVRMTNRAKAPEQLVAQLNVLAARVPRIDFAKALPVSTSGGSNWVFRWTYPDRVDNAVYRRYTSLSRLRSTDPATGAAYWARLDSTLTEDTDVRSGYHVNEASPWYSNEDLFEEVAQHVRGAAADADLEEGVICKNAHTIAGLVVQAEPRSTLDPSSDECVVGSPRTGDPVLGDGFAEKIRAVLHELRVTNVPILVNWAAVGDGADYKDTTLGANSGNEYGVRIDDDTNWRNVLTLLAADATRSATTPGWPCHQYLCGIGDEATTAGKELNVTCRVLAKATTADASVRFEGPSSVTTTSTTITVPVAGGLDWYGTNSNLIQLDTSKANNDSTIDRAKIDVCGKAGSSGVLYIYALRAWVYLT